jgi:ATP-dependent Clp protease ATP-binding subunit ClpC
MEVLRTFFRPEFLNRLDEIIIFEALQKEQIKQIVGLQLERVKRTARGQGIEVVFDRTVLDHLAIVGYLPEYGARELRRQIKNEIENKLARELLQGNLSEGSVVKVEYKASKGVVFTNIKLKDKKQAKRTKARQR